MRRRLLRHSVALLTAVALSSGTVAAHGGVLRGATGSLTVPTWLFLLTGGGVVGASFILASFVTDRAFVRAVDSWHRDLTALPGLVRTALPRAVGLGALAVVVLTGLSGPTDPFLSQAVLVVWVGWWAGYVGTTYAVGNTWPAVDPFRTLARPVPSLDLDYPERLGAWPSVAAVLLLVYVEVVTPLADDPRLLATFVLGYAAVTVVGVALVGERTWFADVDPLSRVFALYGRVAPLHYGDDGLSVRLPGNGLTDDAGIDGLDEVAFVVGVVWVTTYDGLVTTPAFGDLATAVGTQRTALVLYAVVLVVGYGLFLGSYLLAARLARRTGDTYVAWTALARRFAPPLLAIAAGYHLAHFLGYFLSLSPLLLGSLLAPLASAVGGLPGSLGVLVSLYETAQVVRLPAAFGGVELAFVLLGHLVAVWVAHSSAYELFPARLQAVRSQYPFVAVMIGYTMVGLWIVAEPSVSPPFL